MADPFVLVTEGSASLRTMRLSVRDAETNRGIVVVDIDLENDDDAVGITLVSGWINAEMMQLVCQRIVEWQNEFRKECKKRKG
jgi:hypothetical protein